MNTELILPVTESSELGRVSHLAPELALRRAVPLLARLAKDTAFQEAYVLPLARTATAAENWHVAYRHEGRGGSYSLEVFFWPPAGRTRIHDHATWGAYQCVWGSLMEERYERLDDGSRVNHARLKRLWQLPWGPNDGISTVLPYDGGIHRLGNPGKLAAISVHLYGPRVGEVDGRDYDSSRDFVCDRGAA